MSSSGLNVEVSLDELRELVPKFVNQTTLEVGKELLRQGSLLVRSSSGYGLLEITPPIGKGSDAEAIGANSVRNDIYKVFVSKNALTKAMKAVSPRGSVSALNGYLRRGEYEKAKEFLNGQTSGTVAVKGYRAKRHGKVVNVRPYTQRKDVSALNIPRLGKIVAISKTPQASLHQAQRRKSGESTGRVFKQFWAQVVLNRTRLNNYVEDRQKRVGLLKAAWAKAATKAGLNVSIPKFISRHEDRAMGHGQRSFANPLNMFVELINQFPVASSKIKKDNITFLLNTRKESIAKELEHKIAALARAA